MMYWDGDEIEIATSSAGVTWTRSGSLSYDTNDFSIWKQDVGGTIYIFLAVASGNNVVIRRGTFGNSPPKITWDSELSPVTALTATGSEVYVNVYISADTSGYLWVMARFYSGTDYKVVATDSQNIGSSTWTQIAFTWNSKSILGSATASTNINGNIVPLASGDMYSTFVTRKAKRSAASTR